MAILNRLEFIRRNAAAHDFDGYELDFTRFIRNFPQGRERELAPLLTDFVRQVHRLLNAIARQRVRPYLLVVGMGGMPFSLGADQWKVLGTQPPDHLVQHPAWRDRQPYPGAQDPRLGP